MVGWLIVDGTYLSTINSSNSFNQPSTIKPSTLFWVIVPQIALFVTEVFPMNARKITAVLAVVMVLVALLVIQANAALKAGDKAPNFKLEAINGKEPINLTEFTNKPTLLVFWASWCPHCQNELPVVQRLYKELGPKGVNVVGVSVDRNINDARNVIKKLNITFPNGFAGTESGDRAISGYGIRGIPTVFVIGKDGVIKATYAGEADAGRLKDDFAKLGVKS